MRNRAKQFGYIFDLLKTVSVNIVDVDFVEENDVAFRLQLVRTPLKMYRFPIFRFTTTYLFIFKLSLPYLPFQC
jgi:hypothetical protein